MEPSVSSVSRSSRRKSLSGRICFTPRVGRVYAARDPLWGVDMVMNDSQRSAPPSFCR